MSREDIHADYEDQRGEVEVVELGLDHDGKKQWYARTREGWDEVGLGDGMIALSMDNYAVGTRIELSEPVT